MKLIVGLGNPGPNYQNTRHNAGFMALDYFLNKYDIKLNQEKFGGIFASGEINDEKIMFAKPLSYINLSGEFVYQLSKYFQIPIKDILIIYDDCSIPCGSIRLTTNSSSGGHNGMANIIHLLKTKEINRIKIGIKPINPIIDIKDFVLQKFTLAEKNEFEKTFGEIEKILID